VKRLTNPYRVILGVILCLCILAVDMQPAKAASTASIRCTLVGAPYADYNVYLFQTGSPWPLMQGTLRVGSGWVVAFWNVPRGNGGWYFIRVTMVPSEGRWGGQCPQGYLSSNPYSGDVNLGNLQVVPNWY